MKKGLTILLIMFCNLAHSQDEFPVDTINKFNLSLKTNFYLPMRGMITTLDDKGNLRCTYYFSNNKKQRRDTIADKQIILDFNTFRQVKETILSLGLDTLPEVYSNPDVCDGQYYNLELEYNNRKLNLRGSNRNSSEKGFEDLIEYLDKLVGLIAYDYEKY